MGTRAGFSANAVARREANLLLYNCELFRIHHSRRIYPAIALAGHAFEAVLAVWIVSWHLIAPVLISALPAAVNIPYLSDDDVIVTIVLGMSLMFDQRSWISGFTRPSWPDRPAEACHLFVFINENREFFLLILTRTRMKSNNVTLH